MIYDIHLDRLGSFSILDLLVNVSPFTEHSTSGEALNNKKGKWKSRDVSKYMYFKQTLNKEIVVDFHTESPKDVFYQILTKLANTF